jgi:hypothetical protein
MNIIEKLKMLESVYCILTCQTILVKNIETTLAIHLKTQEGTINLYSNGSLYSEGECLIFPSKENRNWESVNVCKFEDKEAVMVRQNLADTYDLRFHTGKMKGEASLCYNSQNKKGLTHSWTYCISLKEFLEL